MDMKMEPKDNELEKFVETLVGFKGRIYFGVPRETSGNRSDGKKTKLDNAMLLAIMEHGSPVKNIPPRELLRPVIEKHEEKIRAYFDKIFQCLMYNDEEGADALMEELAQRVEMWGKKFFVDGNDWTPNSPATIKRKGSDKPLIDTGQLRQSIRAIYSKQ